MMNPEYTREIICELLSLKERVRILEEKLDYVYESHRRLLDSVVLLAHSHSDLVKTVVQSSGNVDQRQSQGT